MAAEQTDLIDMMNVIICGALALHVIAASYINNYKELLYLCKPTQHPLNTISNQLLQALNINGNSGIWHTYNRKQLSHRIDNNWKTNNIYSTITVPNSSNKPNKPIFTQWKPDGDKILIQNTKHRGFICKAKYETTLETDCIGNDSK